MGDIDIKKTHSLGQGAYILMQSFLSILLIHEYQQEARIRDEDRES